MTKTKNTVAIAIVLFAVAIIGFQTVSAAVSFFGGAQIEPGYISLVSDFSDGNPINDGSSMSFDDMNGMAFSSLAVLSTDYDVTDDDCFGGSPRFQIAVDTSGDLISDGNIFVYIGPSPAFSGCTAGWQSSGNLVGNEDAGRWDYTQLGGPLGGYSGAPASVLNGTVLDISVVVDSGWGFPDSEQTIDIDNVTIAKIMSTTYDFIFPDVTVTIVKYIDGVHANATSASSLSFPMDVSWDAANIGAGAGSFSLDIVGFNNPNPYEATTAQMTAGADYSLAEDVTGLNVGANCTEGKPFALSGYTTGNSELEAAAQSPSLTSPDLTNIATSTYIIVWNESCETTLTLEKDVVNDDTGSSVDTDWTLSASGPTPISGSEGDASVTNAVVTPGIYDLSEAGPAGYNASAWVCTGGNQTDDDTVEIADGAQVVCTITNNDTAGPPIILPPPANACDTPTVAPAGYTLQNGTNGNDNVTIAPFTMFVGLGGYDTINGPLDGNYIICTGSKADKITLGNGDFTISAGDGYNVIVTGNGDGYIESGVDTDKITTGNGMQTIHAGNGYNKIETGDGDKNITAGAKGDQITTGSGNDVISAGDGYNKIISGAGDDSITTGTDNDNIDGGDDFDTCVGGGGYDSINNCEA